MASFNTELFRELLNTIEYNIKFSVDGITEPQSFDLKCKMNINDIFILLNKTSNRYKLDELKYCLSILREFDYIHITEGSIDGITRNGLKFIISTLHGIECKP